VPGAGTGLTLGGDAKRGFGGKNLDNLPPGSVVPLGNAANGPLAFDAKQLSTDYSRVVAMTHGKDISAYLSERARLVSRYGEAGGLEFDAAVLKRLEDKQRTLDSVAGKVPDVGDVADGPGHPRVVISRNAQRVRGYTDVQALEQILACKGDSALKTAWAGITDPAEKEAFAALALIKLREASTPKIGLDPAVDKALLDVPSLISQIERLQAQDWRFEYGESGKGTYCKEAQKVIVIDSRYRSTNNISALAHEVGHAMNPSRIDLSSKENYVHALILGEGRAAMNEMRMVKEAKANGASGVHIHGDPDLAAIHDQYLVDGDYDAAVEKIAAIYANYHTSGFPDKTYREYYGDSYPGKA